MNSLERHVRGQRRVAKLPKWLCDRIEAKLARHAQIYGERIELFARALMSQPSLYDQVSDLSELSLFFRPHVVIALSSAALTKELWCPKTAEGEDYGDGKRPSGWVKIARYRNRLLMENPLSGMPESWARLSSYSRSAFRLHHKTGGSNAKSRFFGNYEYIKPLEYEVFNKGVGLLLSATKMRLYAEFGKPIGRSTTGQPLTHVCLEVTRERRPPRPGKRDIRQQSGWMVYVHGYPLSIASLKADLNGTPVMSSRIPRLANPS